MKKLYLGLLLLCAMPAMASAQFAPLPDPGLRPYPGPGTAMPTPRYPYGEGPQYTPPRISPNPSYRPLPPGTDLEREYLDYRYPPRRRW